MTTISPHENIGLANAYHITIDTLNIAEGYVRGSLSGEERLRFAQHVETCEECQDRVELARLWLLSMQPGPRREAAPAEAALAVALDQDPALEFPHEAAAPEPDPAPAVSTPPAGAAPPVLPAAATTASAQAAAAASQPLKSFGVSRVSIPAGSSDDQDPHFGEMLAKRLDLDQPLDDKPAANASEPGSADVTSRFSNWQLVILGILLGLLLMAIPAAYFLAQFRRMAGH
jgi:hypothetical protein